MRPLARGCELPGFPRSGATVEDQLVELWQWPKDISKTDKEVSVEARLLFPRNQRKCVPSKQQSPHHGSAAWQETEKFGGCIRH